MILCLLILLLLSAPAHAGKLVTLLYVEPTTDICTEECKPLDDLAGTRVYLDVITDGRGALVYNIPATAQTGGGSVTAPVCVHIRDFNEAGSIEVEVTAYDTSGNESPPTPTIVTHVEGRTDCVVEGKPAIPQKFSIR